MSVFLVVIMEVVKVERATKSELVELAIKSGFDLNNYIQIIKIGINRTEQGNGFHLVFLLYF